MSVFVDTSAFLALLNRNDEFHEAARGIVEQLAAREETLICTNYILLETFALLRYRLGLDAARTFQEDVFPVLQVEWVDQAVHMAGVTAVLAAARKKLSLVDCVSFDVMRHLGIKQVFTFDPHFAEQGFDCLPEVVRSRPRR